MKVETVGLSWSLCPCSPVLWDLLSSPNPKAYSFVPRQGSPGPVGSLFNNTQRNRKEQSVWSRLSSFLRLLVWHVEWGSLETGIRGTVTPSLNILLYRATSHAWYLQRGRPSIHGAKNKNWLLFFVRASGTTPALLSTLGRLFTFRKMLIIRINILVNSSLVSPQGSSQWDLQSSHSSVLFKNVSKDSVMD